MTEKWRMTLNIEVQTAFHTLGPGRTLPLIDRMLQVDPQGKPMIPGSSVRGHTRAHLERLLKASGHPVCRPPQPKQTCPHDPAIQTALQKLDESYCLACRIFGSVWRESGVSFGNYYLVDADLGQIETIHERTSVAINRRLGAAQAERLFMSQTTAPGMSLTFTGPVEGYLKEPELGWLLAAFRLVNHLGGDKARGLGQVSLEVTDLYRWATSSREWLSADAQSILKEVLDNAAL